MQRSQFLIAVLGAILISCAVVVFLDQKGFFTSQATISTSDSIPDSSSDSSSAPDTDSSSDSDIEEKDPFEDFGDD